MGRSNIDRLWMAGGIIGAIFLLLISWLFLLSPTRSDISSLHDEKANADVQNRQLEATIRQLQNANLGDLRAQLQAAQAALPGDSGLPEFIRQLAASSDASLVKVTSITAAAPIPVGAGAAAAVAGAPAPGGSAAGKVFGIPVTIIATGATPRLQALLHRIQADGPRRALVSSVVMAPSSGIGTTGAGGIGANASMTAQMTVFVAPQTPAAQAEIDKLITGAK